MSEYEKLDSKWIDEHSNGPSRSQYVWVDDLKELLVPKQEELKRVQIPEWIIEWYQGANNEYSTLEDVFSNLSHDTGYNIVDSEKFRSRIMEYGGFSKMYEALSHIYFGVYEIEEEEEKYYAKLKEIRPLEGEWLTNLSGPNYYVLDTKGLMLGEFILDFVGMKAEASTHTLKDWERYGINDSNADFVKAEELEK